MQGIYARNALKLQRIYYLIKAHFLQNLNHFCKTNLNGTKFMNCKNMEGNFEKSVLFSTFHSDWLCCKILQDFDRILQGDALSYKIF